MVFLMTQTISVSVRITYCIKFVAALRLFHSKSNNLKERQNFYQFSVVPESNISALFIKEKPFLLFLLGCAGTLGNLFFRYHLRSLIPNLDFLGSVFIAQYVPFPRSLYNT